MSQPKPPSIPQLKHHKASGRAYVLLAKHRHYLGRHGSPDARIAYDRMVAEWLAAGRRAPSKPGDITVVELVAKYVAFAESYYQKPAGKINHEVDHVRTVGQHVRSLYGHERAASFGPKSLKAVRARMIQAGWARKNTNKQIGRVKRMFKWAVEEELIPPSVYHGLQAVAGLKYGRSEARETAPVLPVPDEHIDAVREHVSPQVWGMIQTQRYTAARPGEVVAMRPIDFDVTGPVWVYSPKDHKTAHHGHTRTIYFGPRAQDVIRPFLAGRAVDSFLFSPREATQHRATLAKTHRRHNQQPSERMTARTIGDAYTTQSYGRAITYACDKAFPAPDGTKGEALKQWRREHRWAPNQLRHNAATNVRKEFGLEGAQLILGHAKADVTQVYAEVNRDKAIAVAAKIG